MHLNKYVYIKLENPLKTWKEVRNIFRKPSIKINFFINSYYNCPYMNKYCIPKILCIQSNDVSWKWKWREIRYEKDPYIWVCFFRKFGFSINYKILYKNELGENTDGGLYYWEYLLRYLYMDNRNLKAPDIWTEDSKLCRISKDKTPYKIVIPTQLFSLNNNGFKLLQEKYGSK